MGSRPTFLTFVPAKLRYFMDDVHVSNKVYIRAFGMIKHVVLFIGICCFLGAGGEVYAQSSSELKKQRERLDREIKMLDANLKATKNERSLTLRQYNALTTQMGLREKKIHVINGEISLLNKKVQSHQRSIKTLQDQLNKLREDYEKMIRFAYRNRNAYNKMMFVFASSDFNQAYKRVKFLKQLNESRKARGEEIEKTRQELSLIIAQLEVAKLEQGKLLEEQKKERQVIASERSEESKALKELSTQEKQFTDELKKLNEELRRLRSEIDQAIAREVEEARKKEEARRLAAAKEEAVRTGKTLEEVEAANPVVRKTDAELLTATPEAAKLAADFLSNKGKLPWPVTNGIITMKFGPQRSGINVVSDNTGVRIRTMPDAPVRAIFNGTVSLVKELPGLGYVVMIRHGRYISIYANLQSVSVKAGQSVVTSQSIGVAYTDGEGVAEIQFEISDSENRQNPEIWLAK
jgi:septal ring factor EnvC (AmiA/AmiB activator)